MPTETSPNGDTTQPSAHNGGGQGDVRFDPSTIPTVSPPTVREDNVPSKCLSFVLRGDWGHFRRIDRTVTRQTYRIPPRTTVAGILAAIVGVGRDSYYDTFDQESSAVAVSPLTEIRTVTEPVLSLSTNPDETMSQAGASGRSKGVTVQYPDSAEHRQIYNYELLVDPAYRIDVAVEDEKFYSALKHRLETGTVYYTPSLGLSEFLASVEPVPGAGRGEFEFEPQAVEDSSGTVDIDSIIPNAKSEVVPQPGQSFKTERMPAYMEQHDGGRRTTEFSHYTFTADPDESIPISPTSVTPATIDGHTVIFD